MCNAHLKLLTLIVECTNPERNLEHLYACCNESLHSLCKPCSSRKAKKASGNAHDLHAKRRETINIINIVSPNLSGLLWFLVECLLF